MDVILPIFGFILGTFLLLGLWVLLTHEDKSVQIVGKIIIGLLVVGGIIAGIAKG